MDWYSLAGRVFIIWEEGGLGILNLPSTLAPSKNIFFFSSVAIIKKRGRTVLLNIRVAPIFMGLDLISNELTERTNLASCHNKRKS